MQNRLVPLHDALFAETSPAPVKFAASLLGKTVGTLPPAAGADDGGHPGRVSAAMTEVGLLN